MPKATTNLLLARRSCRGSRSSSGSTCLREAPASPELPPVHKRDRWQEIAASQVDGAWRMAVHLEDDRGHCEHEAGDKLRPAPTSPSYNVRWRRHGSLRYLCHVAFPFKIGCRVLWTSRTLCLGSEPCR